VHRRFQSNGSRGYIEVAVWQIIEDELSVKKGDFTTTLDLSKTWARVDYRESPSTIEARFFQ
jgi:hypothetical protein